MTDNAQILRGSTLLAVDAIRGVTRTVEQMHETIARHPLPWARRPVTPGRGHGILAAAIYGAIRTTTGLLGNGVERTLEFVADALPARKQSLRERSVVAALNGVCGDHLEHSGNPLAISMHFSNARTQLPCERAALASAIPAASGHIAVFVHGLCMADHHWLCSGKPDLGARLASDRGVTPVYLNYNSGRHISSNGRELAEQLQNLVAAWPVPVQSLSLLGHSMGGLLIRSACWYADQQKLPWLCAVRRVFCIGSPHHGAPLERAGHLLGRVLRSSQYLDPLDLGSYRSAGIKDLRYGNLLDEDWQRQPEEQMRSDRRCIVPLLAGIDYFLVAATVGGHGDDPKGRLLGDLLVRCDSALGAHRDPARRLPVAPENCRIFHERNHFDLLRDTAVHDQVVDWFAP